MAPKYLVDADIEHGKQLVQELDRQHVPFEAALWAYRPESERYELVIASRTVETEGIRPLYVKIRTALESLPETERVRIRDIAVTSPSRGIVAALKTAVNTPADAIASIRMTNNVVNRELIDDAYIYRMCVPHTVVSSDVSEPSE